MHQPIELFTEPAKRYETNPRYPMHLSTQVPSLAEARSFYGAQLGCEERRATKTSVHFDFFGNQLTLHEVEGFTTVQSRHEDLPVRSFGAAVPRTWILETLGGREVSRSAKMLGWGISDPSGTDILFDEDRNQKRGPQPMRLSVNCQNIDVAHRFYSEILGCMKVNDMELSGILKLDFFGHSLSLIETAGFNAVHMHASVAAEDVPVPHFGVALDEDRFQDIGQRLESERYPFILHPHKRFIGKPHDQWVLFILDPAGNALEIKSFTNAKPGAWL